jgi:CheY-like chemotaxis protein
VHADSVQYLPIIVVDDSEDDILLLTRSLKKARIQNQVVALPSGKELVRYLKGEGSYMDRELYPLPGIIFLDVHMPEMDGFQVLDWLRNNKEFHLLPVVVLTGTMPLTDATTAYQKGAASFLSKPCLPEQMTLLPENVINAFEFTGE